MPGGFRTRAVRSYHNCPTPDQRCRYPAAPKQNIGPLHSPSLGLSKITTAPAAAHAKDQIAPLIRLLIASISLVSWFCAAAILFAARSSALMSSSRRFRL